VDNFNWHALCATCAFLVDVGKAIRSRHKCQSAVNNLIANSLAGAAVRKWGRHVRGAEGTEAETPKSVRNGEGVSPFQPTRGSVGASWAAPPAGSTADNLFECFSSVRECPSLSVCRKLTSCQKRKGREKTITPRPEGRSPPSGVPGMNKLGERRGSQHRSPVDSTAKAVLA